MTLQDNTESGACQTCGPQTNCQLPMTCWLDDKDTVSVSMCWQSACSTDCGPERVLAQLARLDNANVR
ncbi:hypothetical protein C7T79_13950 [Xanthomonas oryzae pv. oryzicola]|nr:hypothetical protein C7T79_13950 [Xanthomonas oryzae pv. oryzicola]